MEFLSKGDTDTPNRRMIMSILKVLSDEEIKSIPERFVFREKAIAEAQKRADASAIVHRLQELELSTSCLRDYGVAMIRLQKELEEEAK